MSDDRYRRRRDPDFDPHNESPSNSRDNSNAYLSGNSGPAPNDQTRSEHRDDYRSRENSSDSDHHPRNRDHYKPRGTLYPVRFHGKTSEYFKIWIVNVFLTVITLYIYSAWAKVRTKRYFYGNTTIDNSSFEYHATGRHLVVGRLIAAVLVITYTFFQGISPTIAMVALGILVVMFPWAVWRSLRFNAKASSYRNIRFGFQGQASPPYVNIIVVPAVLLGLLGLAAYLVSKQFDSSSFEQLTTLPVSTLNSIIGGVFISLLLILTLVVPLLHKNLISYSLNNHRFGTARFAATINTGRIYAIHLLTILISFLAIMVVSALLFSLFKVLLESTRFLDSSEILTRLEPYVEIISAVLAYLFLVLSTGIAVAYFRSRIRNLKYNSTRIDSGIQLQSTTTTWSLWWLNISNLALLIFSLGLAYPYTKIRSARYFARHTKVLVAGGLDSFTERERTRLNAMGEEMADAFDIEFDIGF